MSVSTELSYETIHNLYLDPGNPRLGSDGTSPSTSQSELLEMLRAWVLDELACSYLACGAFWTFEPLIVVNETLYGCSRLVVVDGNRRLAALKLLDESAQGRPAAPEWESMLEELRVPDGLLDRVPFLLAESRQDVRAFQGFRHANGIKHWDSAAKAAFMAVLIDDYGMAYHEVAKKLGSKSPAIRRHYIAHRLLTEAENILEDFDRGRADRQFAILYMVLGTVGAQDYLHIDMTADPGKAKTPMSKRYAGKLAHFCRWLFGTPSVSPILSDSRQVADFAEILTNRAAVKYLETEGHPNFEVAFRIAGGDKQVTVRYIAEASQNVRLALMRAHAFKSSTDLRKAVGRLEDDTRQLLRLVPAQ